MKHFEISNPQTAGNKFERGGGDLVISDVSKIYTHEEVVVEALRGINLTIPRGSFLSLFGPSGSGKTTLLNLIGGLDRPTTGEIQLGGTRIHLLSEAELAEHRLNEVGFVFQAYNLIPVLSAQENVEFVLHLRGMKGTERATIAKQALANVGLKGLEGRRPGKLSGGQQQRVAIARAIVGNPKLILADEPTANLDSETAKGLLVLMRSMNEEYGVTFVFSTHDPLVMQFAKRLVQIKDGTIASDESR